MNSQQNPQEVTIGAELSGRAQNNPGSSQARLGLTLLAFLLGFGLMLLVMLPNLWALLAGAVVGGAAAAGTYGILAGREQSRLRRSEQLNQDQDRLRSELASIDQTVRSRSAQLPPSTQGQLRMMVVGLEDIVDRWDSLARYPEHHDAVNRTIKRHLPRTLELFLALPDTEKPRHAAEFKAQIGLLAGGVAKTRDTVVSKNLQALQTNRWLIEESLVDPDEKLFRDHGL
ncbi:hypothetical protein [Nesterenkonia sp. Act20]|uniref:hypothetical protein n=1 Tax=Nesterenkonia sp. Act20 TaxID=1483432 RepID=UPI001C458E2F|nr:hypothetical protein [Nesterenkonia sp. Act20]